MVRSYESATLTVGADSPLRSRRYNEVNLGMWRSVLAILDVQFWSPFQYAINNTKVQSILGCEWNSVARLDNHGRRDEPVMK